MLIQLQQIECYWPKNVRSHLKDKYLRLVIIQLINIYTTYVHRKPKQTNVQVHKIKKNSIGKRIVWIQVEWNKKKQRSAWKYVKCTKNLKKNDFLAGLLIT